MVVWSVSECRDAACCSGVPAVGIMGNYLRLERLYLLYSRLPTIVPIRTPSNGRKININFMAGYEWVGVFFYLTFNLQKNCNLWGNPGLKRKEHRRMLFQSVRAEGLEPTRRKTLDPKSSAATNYATRAYDGAKVRISVGTCK